MGRHSSTPSRETTHSASEQEIIASYARETQGHRKQSKRRRITQGLASVVAGVTLFATFNSISSDSPPSSSNVATEGVPSDNGNEPNTSSTPSKSADAAELKCTLMAAVPNKTKDGMKVEVSFHNDKAPATYVASTYNKETKTTGDSLVVSGEDAKHAYVAIPKADMAKDVIIYAATKANDFELCGTMEDYDAAGQAYGILPLDDTNIYPSAPPQ
jgi:hypothetical protein